MKLWILILGIIIVAFSYYYNVFGGNIDNLFIIGMSFGIFLILFGLIAKRKMQ